jgi:hypothetical protein
VVEENNLSVQISALRKVLDGAIIATVPGRGYRFTAPVEMLEWSHALLDEREQAVFRRLAVVAGSASLALIQRIATCEHWNEWDVLDALVVLVERSLVTLLDAAHHAAPRYPARIAARLCAREAASIRRVSPRATRTRPRDARDAQRITPRARDGSRALPREHGLGSNGHRQRPRRVRVGARERRPRARRGARRLARAALGAAEFERLHAEGARSGSDEVAALAFGTPEIR